MNSITEAFTAHTNRCYRAGQDARNVEGNDMPFGRCHSEMIFNDTQRELVMTRHIYHVFIIFVHREANTRSMLRYNCDFNRLADHHMVHFVFCVVGSLRLELEWPVLAQEVSFF